MYPLDILKPDCVTFVPSLAAPTQMLMVQHLFEPRKPLSPRDLYVLQRMALPDGQPWLFTLTGEDQTTEMVQISLVSESNITPREALASPACITPPMLRLPTKSATQAPPPLEPDLTGIIYGDG